MKPERQTPLEALFHRLAPLRPKERDRVLAEERPDPDLRAQLEALLEAHDGDNVLDEALDVEGLQVGVGRDLEGDAPRPGDAIGPFRVLEILGSGGMGTVCLAEQRFPVQRRVAVKLIRRAHDSHELRRRFESERQALALLESPHIARILDIGSTEDGRPFYAMEYVAGTPITVYADQHGLGMRERLDLFLRVCEGIRHAHQRGIIHRDIKPSNVLVVHHDDTPVVKIIDFGIAKVLGMSALKPLTQHGIVLGTPEYMSPEAAAAGYDVDTRSDVYSAGVLLYELLAGHRPRTRDTDGFAREETAGTLLRGELIWICRKALEEDRNDRYQSIAELAEDVRRVIAHQPVLAGPPSARYRLRKFVRRHRVALAAGLLVALVLAAATAVSTSFYFREKEVRLVAQSERQRSDAVGDFFRRLLSEQMKRQPDGAQLSRADALASAVAAIEDDASLDERDRAHIRLTVANICLEMGEREVAAQLLEEAAAGFASMDSPDAHQYAECLISLAVLAVAQRPDEAKNRARRAIEQVKRGYDDETLENLVVRIKAGQILTRTDARREAIDVLREAREIGRAMEVPPAQRATLARLRVRTLLALHQTLLELGELPEAAAFLGEADMLRNEADLTKPNLRLEFHRSQARLAGVFHRWPEAAAEYDSAATICASLFDERYATTVFYRGREADALARNGQYDEADAILEESIRWCDEDPEQLGGVRPILLYFRAEASRARQRLDAAQRDYDAAWRDLPSAIPNPNDEWYARVDVGQGLVKLARDEIAGAEEHFLRARAAYAAGSGENTIELLELEIWLARLRLAQERYPEAEALALHAYERLRDLTGPSMPSTIQTAALIESLYTTWNQPAKLQAWRHEESRQPTSSPTKTGTVP